MTCNQPEPEGLSRAGAIVLCVIGAVLLLPGLCSLYFAPQVLFNPRSQGANSLDFTDIRAAGLILGALGVRLIIRAFR
jgi:hypothetical protein